MRTNDEIINIIIEQTQEKGYSLTELAKLTGMAKSSLSRYFNKSRQFPLNKAEIFAQALNLSTEFLLGVDKTDLTATPTLLTQITDTVVQLETPRQQNVYTYATEQLKEQNTIIEEENVTYIEDYRATITLNFYGAVSAGTGEWLGEEYAEPMTFYDDEVPSGTDFVLKVNGDSMYPMFKNGQYIFIQKTNELKDDTIGVVIVNGDAYVKRLILNKNSLDLVSLNPKYDTIKVTAEDSFVFVGEVL